MPQTSASSTAQPQSSSRASSLRPAARLSNAHRLSLRMPLDEPADDFGQMVRQLKQCPPDDLRRARRHHRRALEALRDGCYEALCQDTRDVLIGRLQTDLDALNRVLEGQPSGNGIAA